MKKKLEQNLNSDQKVEINDESRGTCSTNSQIKFKTKMLKSSLCDYGDDIYLLKDIKQLKTQQLMMLLQIIQIKK